MPFSPAFVLSVLVASLYAVLFHLLWGKRAIQLLLYWVIALVGFQVGQWVARLFSWRVLMIGDVHLLEGSLASVLALLIAKRLKM